MSERRTAVPARVGPYRILRELGAGGMGRVLLGEAVSGRRVAVKLIHAHLLDAPQARERFAREITLLRRVSGAFTAPVVDADTEADAPWVATQFIDAPTLEDGVGANGPLPAEQVWRLAAGLVEALREMGRADVVHRDLKPSNILLTDDGPRVIDFGISHLVGDARITRVGYFIGTPEYMAPEQATESSIGAAADVFALGGVVLFAATGHGPFPAESIPAQLVKLMTEEPDLTGLPDELRELVAGCLAKKAADRPSADDLDALFRQRSGVPRPARFAPRTAPDDEPELYTVTSPRPEPSPVHELTTSRRPTPEPAPAGTSWAWTKAVVAVLAVLGALAVLLWKLPGLWEERSPGGKPGDPATATTGAPQPGAAPSAPPGSAPPSPGEPGSLPPAGSLAGLPACASPGNAELVLTGSRPQDSKYRVGEQVKLTLEVRNTGKETCAVDLSQKTATVEIKSGADHIWSPADCAPAETPPEITQIQPGKSVTRTWTWTWTRSDPARCNGRAPALGTPPVGARMAATAKISGIQWASKPYEWTVSG
ncbi:protein kinase domain-containing protein [Yinghuangia soli]|uniref:non-specific serine/threonine protein kinase n=1 Tax=Yinghuangia soli TaxID=2908204 RepID=A0AA41TZ43_9ACTN|nr:protein kinase [Yinghuangia soli]MCF2528448.1 serine/threonine protein kinase [Yinghuangia soli]